MSDQEHIELFKKSYDGESIVDIWRDVSEALDTNYNELMKRVHIDEWHIPKGKFTVTIEWDWQAGESE